MKLGSKGPEVKNLKVLLNIVGDFGLDESNENFGKVTENSLKAYQRRKGLKDDGVAGPKTMAALLKDTEDVTGKPKVKPLPSGPSDKLIDQPWLKEAKKYDGKKETDSAFSKFLSPFWSLVGLSGYKKIAGNKYAWCGMFVAAVLHLSGFDYQKNGAAAVNWLKYGQKIEWQVNGIPHSAIVQLNHKGQGNCGESGNNHVGIVDAQCAAQDIVELTKDANGVWRSTGKIKKGVKVRVFGGNQGNTAKDSFYSIEEVCGVRWPWKFNLQILSLPPPVNKSIHCGPNGESAKESTR